MAISLEQVGTPEPLWRSAFLVPLEVTPLDDGINWRVDESYDFESAILDDIITVPAGFVTDFASIPRAFWCVLWPTGKYAKAAVIHDYLYRTKGKATKVQADLVFLEAMQVLGVSRLVQRIMYQAVHRFGFSSYHGGL